MRMRLLALIAAVSALLLNLPAPGANAAGHRDFTGDTQSTWAPSRRAVVATDTERGLRVGDIVETGIPSDGGCRFDPGNGLTLVADGSSPVWVVLVTTPECSVRVEAIWTGPLESGPAQFVDRLIRTREGSSEEAVGSETGDPSTRQSVPASDGTALSGGCTWETHKNEIYMYGFGGVFDKLTRLTGWIQACRDSLGSFVDGTYGGQCWASAGGWNWDWVIEKCVKYGFELRSWTVAGQQRGDYHCDPRGQWPCNLSSPDGYDHSLHASQRVYFSGTTYCTTDYSGQIVLGTFSYNVVGCGIP